VVECRQYLSPGHVSVYTDLSSFIKYLSFLLAVRAVQLLSGCVSVCPGHISTTELILMQLQDD